MRTDGSRVDAQMNRGRLIGAVGDLLADDGSFTLSELADHAEVSRATTYRNFSTPDDAVEAFINQFLNDFEIDVSAIRFDHPLERLLDLCRAWARLVEQQSHALVHVRSTEGFLSRAARNDAIIGRIHRLVHAAVLDAMVSGDLPASDPDYAVFLWNLLLDPRELLDLAQHQHTSVAEAAEQLTADFLTLLRSRR